MAKPEFEFTPVDSFPWEPMPGEAKGLYQRVLAQDPETGVATRILKFEPGADSSPNGVQIHDFWEEIYIIEGSVHDLVLNKTFTKGMFAVRPPGMKHGPWKSETGCMLFEVRYYSK